MVPLKVRRGLVACGTALLLAAGTTACGEAPERSGAPSTRPTATPTPTEDPDPAVRASGSPMEVGETASTAGGGGATYASPVYTFPAGAGAAPVALELRLSYAVPTGKQVLVAQRAAATQPWTYRAATLTGDHRHAAVSATPAGEMAALLLDRTVVAGALRADLDRIWVGDIDPRAKRPTCDQRKQAREDGYAVTGLPGSQLLGCLDRKGDARQLVVTNRRTVPVEVARGAARVVRADQRLGAWRAWAVARGADELLLAPGRSATLDVSLEPSSRLPLSAQESETARSLHFLRSVLQALSLRLVALQAGSLDVGPTLESAVAAPRCARTLALGTDAILQGCLAPGRLARMLGSRALLVAPALEAKPVRGFLRREYAAGARPASTQAIVVTRAAPDFSAFVGQWTGPDRVLRVTRDGGAVESVFDGPKKVIEVRYRLSEPHPDTSAATPASPPAGTATATVTGVRVVRPELWSGRLPRVGDSKTLTQRGGVIASPFIDATYCNGPAAKKGLCGS